MSWANRVAETFLVRNYSKPGASCSFILNSLTESINTGEITTNDYVIICWSDKNRDYLILTDPDWRQQVNTRYSQILTDTATLLASSNLKHLVLWGFPSEYGESNSWNSEEFLYMDKDTYHYTHNFDNMIKPALIYYSRQELKHITDHTVLGETLAADLRPNHIGNMETHAKLTELIFKFINNEITGCVDIEENNGS